MGKILNCFSVLLLVGLLAGANAAAEYYQWEDADGNLRFTDDTASIPAAERQNATAIESVRGSDASLFADTPLLPVPAPEPENDAPLNNTRESIEALRADLDKTATTLTQRRQELEGQIPGEDASAAEKQAYFEKVNALNADIDAYAKQRDVYNERVTAYNDQLKRRAEEAQQRQGGK